MASMTHLLFLCLVLGSKISCAKKTNDMVKETLGIREFRGTTPIIPISVCYYSKLRNAITSQLAFKYLWTNHLSQTNKGCAPVGTKTSNDNNNKSNNTTTQQSQLQIFVFHVRQPSYLCSYAI